MKINSIIGRITALVLIAALGYMYLSEYGKRKLSDRNLIAAISKKDMEIQITKQQSDKIYGSAIDSLARELGIKPKQLVRWMVGQVRYQDTGSTVIVVPKADTVLVYPDSLTAHFKQNCYTLDVLFYKGAASHTLNYRDDIIPVIFRERPYKFWFIRYGKWQYRAEILSMCSDSSIKVINNVSIKNR